MVRTYHWLVDHPGEFALLCALGLAISFLVGAAVIAVLKAHEEAKQDAQRQRFERYLQANTPPRDWPIKPGPKGIERKRRAS